MATSQPPQSAAPDSPPPMRMQPGPPYTPQVALLGGQPTISVDDPISGVLIFLFLIGAVLNMTVFQRNNRRSHKFIPSVLLFGFCMARVAALVLRIAWASRPFNANIAIAANIFTAAGVLLLFIINLLFTQRLVRAFHPAFGWHRGFNLFFYFLYFCIVAMLVMVVTASVQSFFTVNPDTRRIVRDIQLFSGTFLAALAFLPIPIILAAVLWPHDHEIDNFGDGGLHTKVFLVLFTATLLSLGAGFRVGVSFDVRPISQPAWFHHKAAYYCFNFVIELVVVFTYTLTRVDRRFHIPNGSSGPGHYTARRSGKGVSAEEDSTQTRQGGLHEREPISPGETAEDEWEKRAKRDLEKQAAGEPT